jgi:hypothetical protein
MSSPIQDPTPQVLQLIKEIQNLKADDKEVQQRAVTDANGQIAQLLDHPAVQQNPKLLQDLKAVQKDLLSDPQNIPLDTSMKLLGDVAASVAPGTLQSMRNEMLTFAREHKK